jgi:hypothetical protein
VGAPEPAPGSSRVRIRVPIGPRQPKTHLIEFLIFLAKPVGT